MRSHEVREAFLDFFAARGHKVVPSSALLPKDDPTILFTNAGMNQFKNVFLGLESRSYRRAASVQKCMRVSGKHNDLETVGRTGKHHTFFEMLGNFSFGDYFKAEAVEFAWELVTAVFRIPPEKLYATVYLDDDEAYGLWSRRIGLPPDRIFRYGKKDNFWAMGETGPCGPCSEIHIDLGAGIEGGDPEVLIEKGSERFLELWNLVFMEFTQDEKGVLHPLPSPSIDTGMGLERMVAVLQGKTSNFDTDLFMPLIEAVSELAGREYPSNDEGDVSVRIIADHVRAATFLVNDGVTPANDGRGYVLRRLIRRASRQGNRLGVDRPFLFELVGRVADIMKEAYPELLASAGYVSRVCLSEEERFSNTLSAGIRYFDQAVGETLEKCRSVIPGESLFKLYDTFGFPLDLSRELAREKNLDVDEDGFLRELEEQRKRARLTWKGDEGRKDKDELAYLRSLSPTSRAHDEGGEGEAEIVAVLKDGRKVDALREGEEGDVILAETPFYAEAGGQMGDSGSLKGSRFSARVTDTVFLSPEVVAHRVAVLSGELKPGETAEAAVDLARRRSISIHHTATHLLHAALRQVLGDHVRQAGSLVSPAKLRFDFNHYAPLSEEQIRDVESLVNAKIREDLGVEVRTTTLEEGLREGATAIFEEKYGENVRVIGIRDFSKELCGGIHVRSTGEIGFFKIVSEAGIAAGMRRVEAVAGEEALRYVQDLEALLDSVEKGLGAGRPELLARIEKMKETLETSERENRRLRKKMISAAVTIDGKSSVKGSATVVRGIALHVQRIDGLSIAELRDSADSLKQKMGSGLVVLGGVADDKAFVVVSITKDLTNRIQAGALIKELAPLIGGGGGGRPDFAQSGGPKTGELDKTLGAVASLVEKLVR
jgi:alanyl-tRNA synthetase